MSRKVLKRTAAALLSFIGAAAFAAPATAQDSIAVTVFGQPSVNQDSVWMAVQNNYFADEGLDMTYRLFPSGTTAFQSFQTGQGDIIFSGDLPSVQYFFNSQKGFKLIGIIERDTEGYVAVARKDITKPEDLVGKTIATRVGSSGSWFIAEYLEKNGVDPSTVKVMNLDTQVLPTALCQGDISAFFIWQPVGSRALEICPDDAHYLSDSTGYMQGYLTAGARAEWLETPEGKEAATRFLRAAIKGRDIAESDFPAVAAYAKQKLELSEQATLDQWEIMDRPLSLDEIFYSDFCDLSKWAQSEGITKEPLDFNEFVWLDGLREIDPELAVTPPEPC